MKKLIILILGITLVYSCSTSCAKEDQCRKVTSRVAWPINGVMSYQIGVDNVTHRTNSATLNYYNKIGMCYYGDK
jgi:hypothetical protein